MRVKANGKWHIVERFLEKGVETTQGEIIRDEELQEIITEAEWRKGKRYTNEN